VRASKSASTMKLLLSAVMIVGFAGTSHTRIGETEAQSQARYGQAREDLTGASDKPLLPGAVERCYEYQGWRVRAAFAGGACQVIEYVHIPENGVPKQISEAEVTAILEAEKGKSRWKEEKIKAPGPYAEIAKGIKGAFKLNKWERTDGAIAEFALGLVLKISDRNADDWAKRLARGTGKKDPKAGPAKPGEPVPKF
jgi:hypothetical protein